MKGIDATMKIIMWVAVGVIGLIVAMIILSVFITAPVSNAPTPQIRPGSGLYNFEPYIFDSKIAIKSASFVEGDDVCTSLKKCIIYSWQTGSPCEVYHGLFGLDMYSQLDGLSSGRDEATGTDNNEKIIPFGRGCASEDLWYQPIEGIETHVCKYSAVTNVVLKEQASQAGLSYDNCDIVDGSDNVLSGEGYAKPYNGYPDYAAGGDPAIPTVHFTMDSLYSNKTTSVAFISTSSRYNGAGRYKFVVDGAYVDGSGNCRYHLLLCGKPSLALSVGDPIFDLFDVMRNLPTYHFDAKPYYVSDLSSEASGGADLYYFGENEIDLGTAGYRTVQISNAIKEGFNAKGSEMKWAAPWWEIYSDSASNPSDFHLESYLKPWNSKLHDMLKSSNDLDKSRIMVINCGDDGICKGRVKVKIALRRDPIDSNNDGVDEGAWHSMAIAVMENQ